MANEEKTGVLQREKEYVKYVQLLRRAEKDGRLDGAHTCKLCGMRFRSVEDAANCCRVTSIAREL